jgi:2-succinyl-5-enolpyruvyl-6-hydroxy-3-cyclohexene-1-carboxylate synthase
MNWSTVLATTVIDELIRCGLREAVLAPGSRSAPLAMEFFRRAELGDLRLHVRIDERSAAFLALGLAKASRAPVAVVCTSGTAAAHFHAAVIEADESCLPLLVLTADRPPELRGTGANQTIDQLKLYGSAVRWFAEVGTESGTPLIGYWRSLVARATGLASGAAGGPAGPVHLNVPLREPLTPDLSGTPRGIGFPAGRPERAPWTQFRPVAEVGEQDGLIVCGDGGYDPEPLLDLAEAAGWPVLAEPSSNARSGANALSAYQYLIADKAFLAAHRPEVIVSAGRPGLSRAQLALLRVDGSIGPKRPGGPDRIFRHVVLAQGPGRWSDPARTATEVAGSVRFTGRRPGEPRWLDSWRAADRAVRAALDEFLDAGDELSEPRLAREVAAAVPDGGLLWAASSQPIRDLDSHMRPRAGLRVLASRGASGIDGLVSSAIGAALAHQAAGGGKAVALLGDLALLHDSPGLMLGPDEPQPDLSLIVANNDGGGIFSMLEQAAFPESFERLFGTPHGTDLELLARAAGVNFQSVQTVAELREVVAAPGLVLAQVRTERPGQAAVRAALTRASAEVLAAFS